jgi:hypothetical protein
MNPKTRIVLQARSAGEWKKVDADRLNGRSRFSLRPGACGRYRLWWTGSESNLGALKALRIPR